MMGSATWAARHGHALGPVALIWQQNGFSSFQPDSPKNGITGQGACAQGVREDQDKNPGIHATAVADQRSSNTFEEGSPAVNRSHHRFNRSVIWL